MATLGNRIKQLRNEKKINQEQLGNIVGVVKSTISMYESGTSTPSDDIKKIMTEYFDVTMDYLLGMSDIRKHEYKDGELFNGPGKFKIPKTHLNETLNKEAKDEEFSEETRAIARNINNLSSDKKSLLAQLIKTMSDEGDKALNK